MKKFYLLGLAAAGLVAGMYVQGCGGGGTSDGGGGNGITACHSDTDCGTGGICNTAGGVCMTKCSQATDCPDTAKNCDVVKDANGTAVTSDKVCQCQTDQNCGGGSAYCNSLDKLCETKCSDSSGCTGYNSTRTCTNSQCLPSSGGNDGGSTCDATHPCTTTADTATNPYCTTTGTCQIDANGAGGQCTQVEGQGGCAYGAACFNDTATSPLPICEFVSGCSQGQATTPVTNSSPVVYDVTATGSPVSTPNPGDGTCNTDLMQQFTGHYYDPQNDVPTGSTSATYNFINYVTDTGTGQTYYHTNIDSSSDTFTFYMCTDTSGSARAVYLTDSAGNASNTACFSF